MTSLPMAMCIMVCTLRESPMGSVGTTGRTEPHTLVILRMALKVVLVNGRKTLESKAIAMKVTSRET